VVDEDLLPFISGAISEDKPWSDTIPLTSVPPFGSGGICTVRIYRATFYQWGAYPKDITEYRFVVRDVDADPKLYPDTSSPLDSILPGQFDRLLLLVPGVKHYPGDWEKRIGKIGAPEILHTGIPYEFWVYATDEYFNAIESRDPKIKVRLEVCRSRTAPSSIEPEELELYTEVQAQGTTFRVAKGAFRVTYVGKGEAGLRAVGAGKQSVCERFRVLKSPPVEEERVVVYPNPGGDKGNITIEIYRIPIGDQFIRAKIFDSFGQLVKDFSDELEEQMRKDPLADKWVLRWDCTNEKGIEVANGVYHFCVQMSEKERPRVWKKKIGVMW
jgi:hypothetical protein